MAKKGWSWTDTIITIFTGGIHALDKAGEEVDIEYDKEQKRQKAELVKAKHVFAQEGNKMKKSLQRRGYHLKSLKGRFDSPKFKSRF